MEKSVSLLELSKSIKQLITNSFDNAVWIRGEISEIHQNAAGHAYLELIQKDDTNSRLLAKARATCWSNTFRMLKPYFEFNTNETLKAGLKILVCCTIEFHELYGLSLNIKDIEPAYTIGDLAMLRQEIIKRLKDEGVLNMNKQLDLSATPQRIAIISSPTAAGYGDFCDQLCNNEKSYQFYTKLFAAVMQGEQTEDSIIKALDRINEHIELFDTVVIIRGGGATADLSSFDSYLLASYCAQFPIPVITGIGHQRDTCILDLVAHAATKTPTAVAEFLISRMNLAMEKITDTTIQLRAITAEYLQEAKTNLREKAVNLPHYMMTLTQTHQSKLNYFQKSLKKNADYILRNNEDYLKRTITQRLPLSVSSLTQNSLNKLHYKKKLIEQTVSFSSRRQEEMLASSAIKIANAVKRTIDKATLNLQIKEKDLSGKSPKEMLKRGYTLTSKNGIIVRKASSLKKGDTISTLFHDGTTESVIK